MTVNMSVATLDMSLGYKHTKLWPIILLQSHQRSGTSLMLIYISVSRKQACQPRACFYTSKTLLTNNIHLSLSCAILSHSFLRTLLRSSLTCHSQFTSSSSPITHASRILTSLLSLSLLAMSISPIHVTLWVLTTFDSLGFCISSYNS